MRELRGGTSSALPSVSFSQSAQTTAAYDFVEVSVNISTPAVANPFTDASLKGEFVTKDQRRIAVTGFCDSGDGIFTGFDSPPVHRASTPIRSRIAKRILLNHSPAASVLRTASAKASCG